MLSNDVFVKALVSSGRTVSLNIAFSFFFLKFSIIVGFVSSNCFMAIETLFWQSVLVSEEDEEATLVESSKRGKYVW